MADEAPRAPSGDVVLAAVSGPLVWATEEHGRSVIETTATIGAAVALGGQAVTVGGLLAWNPGGTGWASLAAAMLCTAVGLLIPAVQLQWLASGRQPPDGPTSAFVLVRLFGMVVFAVGWSVLAPGWAVILIWPLGIYAGLDYTITAIVVGAPPPTDRLLLRVLCSPPHLGAVVGVVAAASLLGGRAVEVATGVGIALEVVVLTAVASFGVVQRVAVAERDALRAAREAERTSERHRRAHWIHDDVCADLRTIRIKLATRALSQDEVASELDDLDLRLRLRQLDEILDGGSASAAEVLQPYLRRAQSAGVRLVEVPRYEAASLEVSHTTAALLRRSVAGLVSNAVAAGAAQLSIRLLLESRSLTLAVEDDAGGFDLAAVPAGRGLALLASDLGPENLVVQPTASGSIVTVHIPMETAS